MATTDFAVFISLELYQFPTLASRGEYHSLSYIFYFFSFFQCGAFPPPRPFLLFFAFYPFPSVEAVFCPPLFLAPFCVCFLCLPPSLVLPLSRPSLKKRAPLFRVDSPPSLGDWTVLRTTQTELFSEGLLPRFFPLLHPGRAPSGRPPGKVLVGLQLFISPSGSPSFFPSARRFHQTPDAVLYIFSSPEDVCRSSSPWKTFFVASLEKHVISCSFLSVARSSSLPCEGDQIPFFTPSLFL